MSKPTDKKEWIEPLIENIAIIKERELVVPFKIVGIKNDCFLIKISGLYAYVPFDRMPWKYPHAISWEVILLSLEEEVFFGKVFHIDRKPDKPEYFKIYVDASTTRLKEANLCQNKDYEGIVILKTAYGVFVDIGYHFYWKCGSFVGLLHRSKFPDPESFVSCELGQTVVVHYVGKNEKGLMFEKEGYVDLNAQYVGKTVQVKISRNIDGYPDFIAEDEYSVTMPVTKTIYGEQRNAVKKAMRKWQDGTTKKCKILNISKNGALIAQWMPNNDIVDYIGKTVQVKVSKNQNGKLDLLVDDKFTAKIPATKPIYGNKVYQVKGAMKSWKGGEIVDCKVFDVDVFSELLKLRWIDFVNVQDDYDNSM